MHELFAQVLTQRSLSRAGDLFQLEDRDIAADLSEVLLQIQTIANSADYLSNDNDQSVVEICITRVTSAIRETGSIEKHAKALVALLESCLRYNLKPAGKDEDPPHAKIASDILSCVFLNYAKKSVMELALPVAVRFLHQENRELSRNMASYLSLAAIDNATLLAQHIQPIINSIVAGNKSLSRVLPQIYSENKEPVQASIGSLLQILQQLNAGESAEKNSLLQICGMVAKERPRLLELHIPGLCSFLSSQSTSTTVLQIFVDMAMTNAEPFVDHVAQLKKTAEQQPATLPLVAKILGAVGRTSKFQAEDVIAWLVGQLETGDNHSQPALLKEIKVISEAKPAVLVDHITNITKHMPTASTAAKITIQQLKDLCSKSGALVAPEVERKSAWSQTEGSVTVIQVGTTPASRAKTDTITVLSPPGAITSLPNSKNASTSTREINFPHTLIPFLSTASGPVATSSVVTVNSSHQMLPVPASAVVSNASSRQHISSITRLHEPLPSLLDRPPSATPVVAGISVHMDERRGIPTITSTGVPPTVTYMGQPHAIPFRDAVQQFCEKHLEKIKTFMDHVAVRLPIPIKANLEESKHKRQCQLHLICYGQGPYCLYNQNFFSFRTKNARTWIHLMFLAIQARADRAVSQQDPSVGNLKATWDTLKLDSGNSFVRLVTSNFPGPKEQESLLHELHHVRFFDVFEFNAAQKHWACFLCNHPEKVSGLLQDGYPAIEGQLKEKKGRWKFFKRWKTRYFTLSGANITYNKKDCKKETLPVNKIQSVKAVRKGMRDIPKAFEIFTNDQTYVFKAKDGKNAEQWLQCLHIAVARSQKHDPVVEVGQTRWDIAAQLLGSGQTQTKL